MKFIRMGRCCGKTLKILELAEKHNAQIVCFSEREAFRIYKIIQEHGLKITALPISISNLSQLRGNSRPIVFDNADMILQGLVPGHCVIAGTVTE